MHESITNSSGIKSIHSIALPAGRQGLDKDYSGRPALHPCGAVAEATFTFVQDSTNARPALYKSSAHGSAL